MNKLNEWNEWMKSITWMTERSEWMKEWSE